MTTVEHQSPRAQWRAREVERTKPQLAPLFEQRTENVGGKFIITSKYGTPESYVALTREESVVSRTPKVMVTESGFFMRLSPSMDISVSTEGASLAIRPDSSFGTRKSWPKHWPLKEHFLFDTQGEQKQREYAHAEITVTNGDIAVKGGQITINNADSVSAHGAQTRRSVDGVAFAITGHVKKLTLDGATVVHLPEMPVNGHPDLYKRFIGELEVSGKNVLGAYPIRNGWEAQVSAIEPDASAEIPVPRSVPDLEHIPQDDASKEGDPEQSTHEAIVDSLTEEQKQDAIDRAIKWQEQEAERQRIVQEQYYSDEGVYLWQDLDADKLRKGWKTNIVNDVTEEGQRTVTLQGPELALLAVKAGIKVEADDVARIDQANVVDGDLNARRVNKLFVQGSRERESSAHISLAVDEMTVSERAEASTNRLLKEGYVSADGKLVVNYLDGYVQAKGEEGHPAFLTVIEPGDRTLVDLKGDTNLYMQTGYFAASGERNFVNDQLVGSGIQLVVDGEIQPQHQERLAVSKGHKKFVLDLDHGHVSGGEMVAQNTAIGWVTDGGKMIVRDTFGGGQVSGKSFLEAKTITGQVYVEGYAPDKAATFIADTITEDGVVNLARNAKATIQNGRVFVGQGVELNGYKILVPGEWHIINGEPKLVKPQLKPDVYLIESSGSPEKFTVGKIDVQRARYIDSGGTYQFFLDHESKGAVPPVVLRDKSRQNASEVFYVKGAEKVRGIHASGWITLDVDANEVGQMVAENAGKIRSRKVKRGIAHGVRSEIDTREGHDLQAKSGGTVRAANAKEVRAFGQGSRAEVGHVEGTLVASGLDGERKGSQDKLAVVRVDSIAAGASIAFDGYVDAKIGSIPAGVTINVSGEHNKVVVAGLSLQTGIYKSELIDGSEAIRLIGKVHDEKTVNAYGGMQLDATAIAIVEGTVYPDSAMMVSKAGKLYVSGEPPERIYEDRLRKRRGPFRDKVEKVLVQEISHSATLTLKPDINGDLSIGELNVTGHTNIVAPAGTDLAALKKVVTKFRATGTGNMLLVEGQEPISLDGQVWVKVDDTKLQEAESRSTRRGESLKEWWRRG